MTRQQALAALRLQLDWGVDEALLDAPQGRGVVPAAPRARTMAAATSAPPATVLTRGLADQCDDLTSLRAALEAHDGAGLAVTATRLVFAAGDPAAPLIVVDEAPGEAEDVAGVPLAGAAGTRLFAMLASAGIAREAVYALCLVPWRPPGGRTPTPGEVAAALPFAERHIALASGRRVLTLGTLAARALTGETASLSRLRGRWQRPSRDGLANRRVLTLQHPSIIARSAPAKRDAWSDLLMLRCDLDQR